jgi:hypothetical protein
LTIQRFSPCSRMRFRVGAQQRSMQDRDHLMDGWKLSVDGRQWVRSLHTHLLHCCGAGANTTTMPSWLPRLERGCGELCWNGSMRCACRSAVRCGASLTGRTSPFVSGVGSRRQSTHIVHAPSTSRLSSHACEDVMDQHMHNAPQELCKHVSGPQY